GRTGAALAAMLVLVAAAPLGAQEKGAGDRVVSVLDGVYTAAQAKSGRSAFRENCSGCHASSQFAGPTFQRSWSGRALYDLFEMIRTRMPDSNPGSLSRKTYAEIIAYLFSLNGYPAGSAELPSQADPQKRIRIEMAPDTAG
ncbi:MAG: c-type cytochrome, partial [Longimicrobiales bacterium]